MDFGYRAEDILWLVEDGILSLGYQSSSYLTDRVPELGFVDLPFLFSTARRRPAPAMDGELGLHSSEKTEARTNYRILGWYENGFRHISNRLHALHRAGRSCRHAHPRFAERGPGADLRASGRRAVALGPHRGDRRDQGRQASTPRKIPSPIR